MCSIWEIPELHVQSQRSYFSAYNYLCLSNCCAAYDQLPALLRLQLLLVLLLHPSLLVYLPRWCCCGCCCSGCFCLCCCCNSCRRSESWSCSCFWLCSYSAQTTRCRSWKPVLNLMELEFMNLMNFQSFTTWMERFGITVSNKFSGGTIWWQ